MKCLPPKNKKIGLKQGFEKYCKENGHPWTGKQHSGKAKEKISKANSGKNNGMYGKILSKRMTDSKNPMYGRTGNKHPGAKLNYEKAKEIRDKYNSGKHTYAELSKEFNISVSQVGNIVKNEVWIKEENE